MIHRALTRAVANHGVYRRDQFEEEYILQPKRADEEKESVKLNNSTQTLGISSVLITTVAFGAAFAPPGGYVADDHAQGGTPTLAGSYAFDAFTMANMLAFTCSAMGTIGLMYSGITTSTCPSARSIFSGHSSGCPAHSHALSLLSHWAPTQCWPLLLTRLPLQSASSLLPLFSTEAQDVSTECTLLQDLYMLERAFAHS
ncbi:hypothetical protein ACQ4PT_029082 [Festuca glaucescens]